MATLEQLSAALVKADAAGDTEAARAFAGEIRKMKGAPKTTLTQDAKQGAGNIAAGLVRGTGSIGATILAPWDMAKDAIDGKGLSLESNRERRQAMTDALGTLGAETDSLGFGAGKLAGEIAGTAGAGGLVAGGITKVAPGLAKAAPSVVEAIRTGGFSANGAKGAAGLAARSAGGAIAGGASAGLINPEEADTGALIGGALPGATQLLGKGANALGRLVRGPQVPADVVNAVKAATGAGYVIPPTQAKPTLTNRLLEGLSGKITTAQNASAKNAGVTNSLANKALGLADDVKLTPEVLADVRKSAGAAYDAVASSGTITPGAAYNQALDKIVAPALKASQGFPNAKVSPVVELVESLRSPSFDAGSAVSKIKELRTAADDAFRAGNTDVARASKSAEAALESAIEDHLAVIGNPKALQEFKDARQLIAKTYSVEKALNGASGNVDARKLAQQLAKGKPLSAELKQAAEFAARFPKANQAVEGMGSLPQTSPLDWAASGAIGAATSNPLALLGVAARPVARGLALSKPVQRGLSSQAGNNKLLELLSGPEAQQLMYRTAPQGATSR